MSWIVFFFCFFCSSALNIYKNAKFEPNSIYFTLDNLTQVHSQTDCACLCFANAKCLTASYLGLRQLCLLFLTTVDHGALSLMTTNEMASVLIFENKTLPAPSNFMEMNETIFAVWNTTAGHDCYLSSPGISTGNYFPTQGPSQAFDGTTISKYLNFGTCNSSFGALLSQCGQNTGLFLSPRRGISLLLGFRFCTADSFVGRDPMLVTLEGSNQPPNALTFGSSWNLIYNGTSGLDIDPGRYTCAGIQWFSNNSAWYTSYRILVLTKRGVGNFVQYSELELYGY